MWISTNFIVHLLKAYIIKFLYLNVFFIVFYVGSIRISELFCDLILWENYYEDNKMEWR
jgi:hypothetical protein